MYCRKCGKEINDTSKFCPYCGCDIKNERMDTTEKTDASKPGKTAKNRGARKWMIPVAAGVGIVVIGAAAILGVRAMRNSQEQETSTEAVTEEEPRVSDNKESEVQYPQDIVLSDEQSQGVKSLLEILCDIDGSDKGRNFEANKEIDSSFATSFLIWSLWKEIPFADGNTAELSGEGWSVSADVLKKFLQNSINTQEVNPEGIITISDGIVTVAGVTPTCAYSCDSLQIEKVTRTSDTEINVQGTVHYISDFPTNDPYNVSFEVVMTDNPDSMWGGYTLKEIKNWQEEDEDNKVSGYTDEEQKEQIRLMVELLGWSDYFSYDFADDKDLTEFTDADLCKSFLYFAAYFDESKNNSRFYQKYPYSTSASARCLIDEETARRFLSDSIGRYDNSTMDYEGDKIISAYGDVGTGGVESVEITEIKPITGTDIQVSASLSFQESGKISGNVDCVITMTANPDSIWGGYTLKSVDKWEEVSAIPVKADFRPEASSVLQGTGYDYSENNLADGDASTCWAEGAEGSGMGESITFTSSGPQEVDGLAILPGYLKSKDLYEKNGKPVEIQITCGTKTWTENVLEDFSPDYGNPMNSVIYIDFGETVTTDTCTVTVLQAQPGTKYADLCISELYLYRY